MCLVDICVLCDLVNIERYKDGGQLNTVFDLRCMLFDLKGGGTYFLSVQFTEGGWSNTVFVL